ncbi:hypothetical protein [Chitinophaga nivalis]|uniref:Uncharacterized protein n=1 Tax=Chitinophaga nivalis TaxID=2991709 RepID=A0ABT3IRN6_9BACT|nr:hypothetical protein [Chitinophaga nivalis]MCW3463673.1 hypothetical protein [Chitinophaga nivalis]MCW3486637.1 hypothetical protein [Chitinophaga nivalis]
MSQVIHPKDTKEDMIDLTSYFNEAFAKLNKFHKERWIDSLYIYADACNLDIMWDEEDIWIDLIVDSKKMIVACSDFPLFFIQRQFMPITFTNHFTDLGVEVVIDDWCKPMYSINLNALINQIIEWRTTVVSPAEYCINDFIYATH